MFGANGITPSPASVLCTVTARVSARRRAIAAQSPGSLANVYLGAHVSLPPSRMYTELFELWLG